MRGEAMCFSCCGEEMVCLGLVDALNPEVDSIRRWICPICGHGVDLVHFDFDELELRNELENYGEENFLPVSYSTCERRWKEDGNRKQ